MIRASALMLFLVGVAAQAAAKPAECLIRFAVDGAGGEPDAPEVVCGDGDPACDRDGTENGACQMAVALCSGDPPCPAADPERVRVRGKGTEALVAALATVPPTPPACTDAVDLVVSRGRAARKKRVVRVAARDAAGTLADRDRLRLVCTGPAAPRAVIVSTDFETGALLRAPVGAPARARPVAATIHADALVRVIDGTVFVVNRYLGDNLQVLSDRMTTRLQCSTGIGSNPHDVALAAPDKAYVTRYDREALWIVDPTAAGCAVFRRGTIELGALADGDGLPEMSQMALIGERLFVSLQRLDRRGGFVPNGPSWLAVVDTTTDTVTGVVELEGRNPLADSSGLQREPGSGKLLVPQAGNVFRTGDGGIERIDPEALVSEGFIVTEDVLGGTITDFVVVSPQKGYAVVLDEDLRNLLVAFDPQAGTFLGRIFASQHFLSDVALAPDGTLWLADRTLPRPGIRIFDTLTDEPRGRGTIDVGLPPFSLGFLP
jgi:DNA-binding beta-propeller fold protein YncE